MTEIIPMPDSINIHNASHERCDMAVGPCSCGAWHSLDNWLTRIETSEKREKELLAEITNLKKKTHA